MLNEVFRYGAPRTLTISVTDTEHFISLNNGTGLSKPPALSWTTFCKLLSLKSLVTLQIDHWAIPPVDEKLLVGMDPAPTGQSMRTLCLPMDAATNPGISLRGLRRITEIYPGLVELKSRIDLSDDDILDTKIYAARAQGAYVLKELSIGRESLESKDAIETATRIFALFPFLEKISLPQECDKEEDWKHLNKLLKMCQTVARLGLRH